MKKPALIIVGVLIAIVGVFWMLQGLNVFKQSGGMNGNHTFIYVGIVVALVGLGVLIAGVRTRGGTPAA